jgi:hypothetical protein
MNPRPQSKHLDYVFCLLPFLTHESTAQYQTSWLCVLFTTFFAPWIHGPISNILIMCFVHYIFLIHESTAPNQTSWLCVLFTTFFDPWIHGPISNILTMCFVHYLFLIRESTDRLPLTRCSPWASRMAQMSQGEIPKNCGDYGFIFSKWCGKKTQKNTVKKACTILFIRIMTICWDVVLILSFNGVFLSFLCNLGFVWICSALLT